MICNICGNIYGDPKRSIIDICPKHKKMHDNGYIAIIAVDSEKIENTTQMVDSTLVYRTGRVAHMQRNTVARVFPSIPYDNVKDPFIFISDQLMDQIEELLEYAENSRKN